MYLFVFADAYQVESLSVVWYAALLCVDADWVDVVSCVGEFGSDFRKCFRVFGCIDVGGVFEHGNVGLLVAY